MAEIKRDAFGWAKQGDIYRGMLERDELLEVSEQREVTDLALKAFDTALEMGEKECPKNDRFLSWVHAHKGDTLCMDKRFPQAMDSYHKAIAHNPNYPWGLAHMGDCLRLIGVQLLATGKVAEATKTFVDALAAFDKALKLDNCYAWAWAHRGGVLRYMGATPDERYEFNKQASESFTRARELNTDYAWAQVYNSISLKIMGKRDPMLWRPAYLLLAHAAKTYPDIFNQGLHDQVVKPVEGQVYALEEADNADPFNAFFAAGLRFAKGTLPEDDPSFKAAEEAGLI
ncbi:tetratricopeptide repeat protein [Acanthopleuribacter pedis]|uniref:Tetratricopeptide repeat protein n=1 Tax=Acanthopleuribacter pedis TaxID=442870 RepID=A0A8J7Q1P4_9BACT|nr:hypothetical protein [Acanthopleuribacter pedis]MBO1317625.1 hypothetical protein [Acanthopleuribacter pedis]